MPRKAVNDQKAKATQATQSTQAAQASTTTSRSSRSIEVPRSTRNFNPKHAPKRKKINGEVLSHKLYEDNYSGSLRK